MFDVFCGRNSNEWNTAIFEFRDKVFIVRQWRRQDRSGQFGFSPQRKQRCMIVAAILGDKAVTLGLAALQGAQLHFTNIVA